MSTYTDRVEGELTRFTYRTDDGGFAVARVQVGEAEVVAVGAVGHVNEGQHVVLAGRWSTHPQYGRRFRVDTVMVDDPRTIEGLERYLGSGAVKGLGKEFARRVVAQFGLQTLDVIEHEPQRLLAVEGIGRKRLERIMAHWEQDQVHREVHATLRGHGIGQALSNRIVDRYGRGAMGVLTRQPYRLAAEIRGVGFRTADNIARHHGFPLDHPDRAEAGLEHTLREAESDGHCFVPQGELLQRAGRLDIPADTARSGLERLILQRRAIRHRASTPDLQPVYPPALEDAESHVARRVQTLLESAPPASTSSPDTRPEEQRLGMVLNEEQRVAVQRALTNGVAIITGGPGTGKTTTVRVLLATGGRLQQRWLLAAPTGRAARRLAETSGQDGQTLHRLLEYNPRTSEFGRNADRPIDADGVLVDEASMIDVRLMAALLDAVADGTRLVLVGDADQLPSVGPGRVLNDFIRCGAVPVSTLSEVYRQASDSGIVRNAWRVNRGETPISSERQASDPSSAELRADFFVIPRDDATAAQRTLLEVVSRRLPSHGFDPRVDVQVLTPMHNGTLGTVALNEQLQQSLNPTGEVLQRGSRRYRVGDRVIQVRNDYDNDVFNGDTGRVTAIQNGGLVVSFDGRPVSILGEALDAIEPAWAISIHKSQGSEYPAVVIALHRSHRIMLRRNLLYTAMTRARRFCCLIGDPWAIRTAVQAEGGGARWTGLSERMTLQLS